MNLPIIELTLENGHKLQLGGTQIVSMRDAPNDSGHATEIIMSGIVPMADGRLMSPCYHIMESREQINAMIKAQMHETALEISRIMHGQ